MRLTRVYTDKTLQTGQTVELDRHAGHHLGRVLRLRAGADLILFNGDGCEYAARLVDVNGANVEADIQQQLKPKRESSLVIELGQCLSRGERMDYALQKSVELGVSHITPLQSRYCQVRLDAKRLQKRLDHWRGVVRSASEQSGRLVLPRVDPVISLHSWCTRQNDTGLQLILDPDAPQALADTSPANRKLRVLIGPEGGFDDEEITLAVQHGFKRVRLGPRTLRTETATVAILSAVQTLWGDFYPDPDD